MELRSVYLNPSDLSAAFDDYSEAHYGPKAIHQKLKDRQHQYVPGAMEALGNVIDLEIDSLPEIEIPLRQIQIGMTLRQDIRLTDGLLPRLERYGH